MQVELESIIYAMDFLDEKGGAYYHKKGGEVISLSSRELMGAKTGIDIDTYPEWQRGAIEWAYDIVKNKENYIELPKKEEFDDLAVLKAFITTLDENIKKEIQEKLDKGTDISRIRNLFNEKLNMYGWYVFKDNFFEKVAKQWCKQNTISY